MVKEEIRIQELIFNNEPDKNKKPGLALNLARLHASCGNYVRVVELLQPCARVRDANRCEVIMDLGHSLCRLHHAAPGSTPFRHGLKYLAESVAICEGVEVRFVADLRKRESLHARALARLGWALEQIGGSEYQARDCYEKAHEHEPANPYYLTAMLGMEAQTDGMKSTIRLAVKTCLEHARAGLELPYAYFTAGRLLYLLKEDHMALGWYARGIRYFLEGEYCVPSDILANEMDWLTRRVHSGVKPPEECRRILDLLTLAQHVAKGTKPSKARLKFESPVLIIAGGADSLNADEVERLRPLLEESLASFQGTVVSGGTTAGVPGCVGVVAAKLERLNKKQFRLVAYRPEKLPDEAKPHGQYKEVVKCGDGFIPEQILLNWSDIFAAGIPPKDVLVFGFGGGPLSALEYRIALGLGASVGIATGTGGAADDLVADPLWSSLSNLCPLPADPMTVRAFVIPSKEKFGQSVLEQMAMEFHDRYLADNTTGLPDNLKPWADLGDTFKMSNRGQAAYAVEILQTAGFGVRQKKKPRVFDGRRFTSREIEYMAELEHGRWNVERVRAGWRYAKTKNVQKKMSPSLVPWNELPDGKNGVRKYDRDAVRVFPKILAKAGLEVYRK